jgi:uncharacterized protein YkwD
MRKALFRRKIGAVVIGAAITTLLPLGVSAEWGQNPERTLNYAEGDKITKGWQNFLGTWYYFNLDGAIETGWVYDRGIWYYLNDSGIMKTGWVKVDGIWYYLDNAGAMKTGWLKNNGKWYYMDKYGAMQIGHVNIEGKIYYFNGSGEWQETQKILSQGVSENNSDVVAQTVVNGLAELPQNYTISVQAYAENQILELMNKKRIEAGLSPLTLDNTLLQVARYKSNHMIQHNYFDHTTSQGTNWTNWLNAIGYRYTTTGENIAYNNYDSVKLFEQWWNSPGHKANMMNASYTKVGIGVIKGDGKYMGTQTFSN